MKKKNIVIIIICAVALVIGLGVGIYFGAQAYNKDKINFTINDNLPNGNGEKVRVVLLAGQSNAAGCSNNSYLEGNVGTEKYTEYLTGYDNIYINFYSSDINMSNGFVNTKVGAGHMDSLFGPELGMAEKLHELYPNEKIFIVKFAIGGTNLFEQWLSPSSEGKTGYLYTNFIRFVILNMQYLESKGYNPNIEAMCWMQGESDSFSTNNATNYESNLTNLIKDVRADLSNYADATIAFVDACIANSPNLWVYCDLVNQSKLAVSMSVEDSVLIDTNAQGLTCANEPEGSPDLAHYDSTSQILLGKLFAEEVIKFFN